MSEKPSQTEIEMIPTPDHTVILTIPPRAEYITLCRLALAALSGRARLTEETTADLKVAVSEACSYLLRLAPEVDSSSAPIRIEYRMFPDRWLIEVSGDADSFPYAEEAEDPRSESGLGLTIIRALVDELELVPEVESRSVLRLIKHLS